MNTRQAAAVKALQILSYDVHILEWTKAQLAHFDTAVPVAYVLYEKIMSFNPDDPEWVNRDRLILSPEYDSTLLRGLQYFNHFAITIHDLKHLAENQNQQNGQHVEGSKLSTAVHSAISAKKKALQFNRPNYQILSHYTYALVNLLDLVKTDSLSAIELVGQEHLKHLVVACIASRDQRMRQSLERLLKSAEWDIYHVGRSALTLIHIQKVIEKAKSSGHPAIIFFETGEQCSIKRAGWPYRPFVFPTAVYATFDQAVDAKATQHRRWKMMMKNCRAAYPLEYHSLSRKHSD